MRFERRFVRGGQVLRQDYTDQNILYVNLPIAGPPDEDGKVYFWWGLDPGWFSSNEPLVVEFRPLPSRVQDLAYRQWAGRWP